MNGGCLEPEKAGFLLKSNKKNQKSIKAGKFVEGFQTFRKLHKGSH